MSTTYAKDFSSPQGAILCLEDAYRKKDLEACVVCNDFHAQAKRILENLPKLPQKDIDEALIAKTAEVLKLAYRKEKEQMGFPDLTGVETRFVLLEPADGDNVVVVEECRFPDGRVISQRLLMSKTEDGWRVLIPLE